jgi:hypothetical protein
MASFLRLGSHKRTMKATSSLIKCRKQTSNQFFGFFSSYIYNLNCVLWSVVYTNNAVLGFMHQTLFTAMASHFELLPISPFSRIFRCLNYQDQAYEMNVHSTMPLVFLSDY